MLQSEILIREIWAFLNAKTKYTKENNQWFFDTMQKITELQEIERAANPPKAVPVDVPVKKPRRGNNKMPVDDLRRAK